MENLPYHRRNYKLLEKRCNDLFSVMVIGDNFLDQPNPIYYELIHDIVPLIESQSKDLHRELAPQFPDLPKFKENELFDYDALAFLDKAFGLSTKQVWINSDLVPLSKENCLITPLLNAHKDDKKDKSIKRPRWLKAYQSYKHDQANSQKQDLANGPAARDVLEAAGAAFLLLTVAKYLPFTQEVKFTQCDFTFGSDIFKATYNRVLFTRFTGNLDSSCLQLADNWQQAMFVVKDPESYILTLRAAQQKNDQQFLTAMLKNEKFIDFYTKLPAERKNNHIELIVHWYGETANDPKEKAWSERLKKLRFSSHTGYFTAWAKNDNDQLKRDGFDPVVAFNHYKDADALYNYAKLNQDLTDPKQ